MMIAVVGCGISPVGAGLGSEIDGHDLVIRANRAYDTAGKEHDWGRRTDILCVGHEAAIRRLVMPPPFEVIYVKDVWRSYWPHDRKPLAGTFAALHAVKMGARKVTLYGIDLYADATYSSGRWNCPTVFKGHPGGPPHHKFDIRPDRDALLNLPCKVEWRLRRL